MARRRAGDDLDLGPAYPQLLCEQPYDRVIRDAVGGRFGDPHFKLLAAVGTRTPAA